MDTSAQALEPPVAPPRRPVRGGSMRNRAWEVLVLRVAAAVCAVRFAWFAAQIVLANDVWLRRVPDDAFYYFEIGQRLADGQGATFDGIHRTNGFHPLWQGVVWLLASGWQGMDLVRAALLVQIGFLVLAAFLATRFVARHWGPLAAAGCLVLFSSPVVVTGAVDGMESALGILAVVLLAVLVARDLEQPDARWAGLRTGLGCGILVLARLDFLVGVVVALPVLMLAGRWRPRRVLVAAAGFGAVTVGYFGWNLWRFGHLLTVSGTIKLHMMGEWAAEHYGSRLSGGYVRFVLDQGGDVLRSAMDFANPLSGGRAAVLGTCLVWVPLLTGLSLRTMRAFGRPAVRAGSKGHAPPSGRRLASSVASLTPVGSVLLFGAVLLSMHLLVDLVMLPVWVGGWYSLPERAAFAIAVGAWLGVVLRGFARRRRTAGRVTTALVLVTLVLLAGWPNVSQARHGRLARGYWQSELWVTAQWLQDHPVPGRLGAYDAGLLGFELHDRPVVNLDGLVNDFAYADVLMSPSNPTMLDRYRAAGVDVLIGRLAVTDPRRPDCASVIWEDPVPVGYRSQFGVETFVPVVVLDLAPCGLTRGDS